MEPRALQEQEITRENQAKIDGSTHEVQMLKETYYLKYTTNNSSRVTIQADEDDKMMHLRPLYLNAWQNVGACARNYK